jgi:putative phage-type endonuclease
MIIHNCIQGTDEWLKIRLGKFGGTDAQAVATNGKGLETLCFQKVADLMIGKPQKSYTNEDMERGKKLEASARLLYELKTGNSVKEVGYLELNECTGCSPDGLVGDEGMIEIKCPSDRVFVEYLYKKEIDKKYFWQMQHQMSVADRKWCDYVLYNENLDRIEIQRVERDEKAIEKIIIGLEAGIKKIIEIQEKINATTN